jgi:hypothetical protein
VKQGSAVPRKPAVVEHQPLLAAHNIRLELPQHVRENRKIRKELKREDGMLQQLVACGKVSSGAPAAVEGAAEWRLSCCKDLLEAVEQTQSVRSYLTKLRHRGSGSGSGGSG